MVVDRFQWKLNGLHAVTVEQLNEWVETKKKDEDLYEKIVEVIEEFIKDKNIK